MSSAPLVKCDQTISNFKREKRKIRKNHLESISEGGILALQSRNFRDYTYPVPPWGLCSLSSLVRQWPWSSGTKDKGSRGGDTSASMNQSYSFDSLGPWRTEYDTMWFIDVMTSMESKALADLTWSYPESIYPSHSSKPVTKSRLCLSPHWSSLHLGHSTVNILYPI